MSIYDDDEPSEETLKRCKVTPTDKFGSDTGRMRWRVECRFCEKLLHRGTTGPNFWHCGCDEAKSALEGT